MTNIILKLGNLSLVLDPVSLQRYLQCFQSFSRLNLKKLCDLHTLKTITTLVSFTPVSFKDLSDQSARTVEYIDCISAEG